MRRQFGILLGDGTPRRLPDGSWQLYDDVRAEIYGFPASVTAAEYRERVDRACAFLEGKSREWLESLRAEMDSAAERREFEKAAGLRDVVFALEKTLERPRHFERTDPTALSAGESALASLQQALALPSRPDVDRVLRHLPHLGDLRRRLDGPLRAREGPTATTTAASGSRDSSGTTTSARWRRSSGAGTGGCAAREGRFPTCVVIDGGRGQVGAALKAFAALDLDPPPIVGLAKREETIVFPDARPPLDIPLRPSRA